MDVFIIDESHEAAEGLMHKLSGEKRQGQMIPLSKTEMDLYNSDRFKHIHTSQDKSMVIELNPGKRYMFLVDESKTVIDDVIAMREHMRLDAGIVRVRG